jgi:outer membrane protein TolC
MHCELQIANLTLQNGVGPARLSVRLRSILNLQFALGIFQCIFLAIPGCQDRLGTGGTGELVVPPAVLHQVEPLDLSRSIATTAPATRPTTAPAVQAALGIEECRRMALQNNLDLQVSLFNPTIARTSLTQAEAQFEAVFFANLSAATDRTPPAPGVSVFRNDTITPDAGLVIPLRTGGSIRLDVPDTLTRNHFPIQTEDIWTASPNVTVSVPLLQGAGLYVNTQGIRLAFYEHQRSLALTKLEVIRVLADVDHAYWQLYAAREQERVQKAAHDSAVAQLERARRQAKAGVVAEVDVVRAESGVADTVESIITADNTIRQAQRALKRILNDPSLPLDAPTIVLPSTPPAAFPYDLDPERLTTAALHQRMEMLDLELQVAEQTANVQVARNGLLPLVSLQYTYAAPGVGSTFSQSFNQTWEKNSNAQTGSLQLSVPIGNEAARSNLRRALLSRMQTLASKEQQALQIRQEIADAVDTVKTDWQRIVAAHERVVLSARTLDVEVRQFNIGLRTSTDVLIAQSNLASAESAEVSAVSDYQIAQVDIAFATGTVLGSAHIDWQGVPEPNVPRY